MMTTSQTGSTRQVPSGGRWVTPANDLGASPKVDTESPFLVHQMLSSHGKARNLLPAPKSKRPIEKVDSVELYEVLKKKVLNIPRKKNELTTLNSLEPPIVVMPPDLDKTNAIKRRAGAVSRNGNEKVSRNGEDVDLDREGFRSDFKLAPLLKIENLELMGCVEFCFGMIPDVAVKLLDSGDGISTELQAAVCVPDLYQFKVSKEKDIWFMKLPSGKNLAVFNEMISNILKGIVASCRFEAYSSAAAWQEINFHGGDEKNSLQVDIVLYGPRSIQSLVGEEFSSQRVYLQHPLFQLPGTVYENPHFLKFENLSLTDSPDDKSCHNTRAGLLSEDIRDSFNSLAANDRTPQARIQRKFAAVMSSLTRSKHLECLEADVHVKTLLLPHQKQALDFMSQREFGPIPENYSLWKKRHEEGREFFEHQIVGLKKSNPSTEIGGGILADDMGMGKTLTMISTILRTSREASIFAQKTAHPANTSILNPSIGKKINSRATLVIVPSILLLEGWKEEIKEHCDGSLRTEVYHGRGRQSIASQIADADIVLSTYHTVAAESLDDESILFQVNWFRIVLDEAHVIRRITTRLHKAVAKLSSRLRWCLTGTPIQNSLDDLAALIAFVGCPLLDTLPEFRKHIINPLLRNIVPRSNNLIFLLESVCLRRTNKLLKLLEINDNYRPVELSLVEREKYDKSQEVMIREVKKFDTQMRNNKGYFGIFQLELQLRRFCNHGTFQNTASLSTMEDEAFDPAEYLALLQGRNDAKCVYCSSTVDVLEADGENDGGYSTVCGHLLCFACEPRYKSSLRQTDDDHVQCSICSRKISENYLAGVQAKRKRSPRSKSRTSKVIFTDQGISSKALAVVTDIQTIPKEEKGIVFSCWTQSLDLVEAHLKNRNISFVRIDGSHTISQRQRVLIDYHTDPTKQILLMTTGTGAIGLNLTIANHIFILEPQWNPMVESQAVGRVFRMGQTKNVRVSRYITKGTVEESMRSQQIRKLGFAELAGRETSNF